MVPTASEQDQVPGSAQGHAYPEHLREAIEEYLSALLFDVDPE